MQSYETFFVLDKEKDQMQLYQYFCLFVKEIKTRIAFQVFINASKISENFIPIKQ